MSEDEIGAELGLTWRERIQSVIAEETVATDDEAQRLAQIIADEFGVRDNQWVTMRDPYSLSFVADAHDKGGPSWRHGYAVGLNGREAGLASEGLNRWLDEEIERHDTDARRFGIPESGARARALRDVRDRLPGGAS